MLLVLKMISDMFVKVAQLSGRVPVRQMTDIVREHYSLPGASWEGTL